MAIVFTPETAVGKLQVEKKFKELVAAATGADSAYIKAKESMLEYFKDGNGGSTLSAREKADMLSKLVADMSMRVTDKMMDVALKIEMENRDAPYNLAKVVADVKMIDAQRIKVDKENALISLEKDKIQATIDKLKLESLVAQATTYSKTGLKLYPAGDALALPSYTQDKNASEPAAVIASKTDQYVKLANSYWRDGNITVSRSADGSISGLTNSNGAGFTGLTKAQIDVAIRQKKGFDDNMLQHAVNSSANLMGLMLSSQNADLLTGTIPSGSIPQAYNNALTKLTNQS